MLQSMTGYGVVEGVVNSLGRVSIEIKTTNHKFLEMLVHVPEGMLAFEEKIKKEIGSRIKRGRINCALTLLSGAQGEVFINEQLLIAYNKALSGIQKRISVKKELTWDTILHLPGVVSVREKKVVLRSVWPDVQRLLGMAVTDAVKMRDQEGKTLEKHLKEYAACLGHNLRLLRAKYKSVIEAACRRLRTDDEKAAFLKETDITEEMERLAFHIQNFSKKLIVKGPIGKELDFIAQEMQRETNTIGAKSCHAFISGCVVHMKSAIEKIREQVQNVE